MTFDPGFLREMRALDDELTRDLQEAGLEFAEHEVKLATVVLTDGDPDAGTPGTASAPTYKVLSPIPEVELRDQIRFRGGAPALVGQALVIASRDACTREELLGAAWVEVSGVRYRVNGGELREDPFKWRVVLERL